MTGIYLLAGQLIRIHSLYAAIHTMCHAYRADGVPDFEVSTDQEDIAYERMKSARERMKIGRADAAEGGADRNYADAYLETLAVYRKIAEKMPGYDAFLFHGSAIAVDGQAYIFTAASGTGKSTHARLWRELLGSRAVMINDDKPLIRVYLDGTADVYGTPWDGKHHLSCNSSAPVKGICILERSPANSIREITGAEAMPMLVQQTYRPADPSALSKTLTMLDRMNTRFFRMKCNMDISAAEMSYRMMKEEHL